MVNNAINSGQNPQEILNQMKQNGQLDDSKIKQLESQANQMFGTPSDLPKTF